MIVVDPHWWKTLFDEVYLLTDAPIVGNPPLTKREVDVAERLLRLRPTDYILDLCGGQGRHALELARRGYQYLTVLDYAPFLLQRGHREAADSGLTVNFCRGDARAMPLHSTSVDVVLLMANSFGYFSHPAEDRQVLAEAVRVLRQRGRFLIDLTDAHFIRRHFLAESWHEATDEVVVCWKRELADDVVRVREMVLSKTQGLLRDRTYAERLYPPERLCTILRQAGLVNLKVHRRALVYKPNTGTDYGLATHRTLVTATKE
jgi:D-alanine-D-alanine ligase